MRQIFLKKITELNTIHHYDYIFLSGDISHQGQEFNELTIQIITDIISTLNLKSERLILIPGNHDLIRDSNRTTLINEISSQDCPSDYLDDILMLEDKRDVLFTSLKDFFSFHTLIKGVAYPTDGTHHLIELEECNLILMNTTIIANTSDEDGTLLIAKNELLNCLEKISNKEKKTIAMGHHTLDCLDPSEKKEVLTLFDDFNVTLYLSGHVHSANYKLEADYYNEILMIVCSGMHFNGYTQGGFVDIEIGENAYLITQYLWNSEHKYWSTNNNLGRKMENGTLIHILNDEITEKPISEITESINYELNNLFDENERIWKQYGPQSITALQNPLSTFSKIWSEKCIKDIIPNNDRILAILQANKELISNEKREILEQYKNHVEGFKNNQLSSYPTQDVPTFPKAIKTIFE